jgi:hypothetical protein
MNQESYRQVGRSVTGSISKKWGQDNHVAQQPRTVSSIPSKFETTLHSGTREQNAFGGRTFRFGVQETANPGPGSYYKKPSLVRSAENCGSVSHLGFGSGFVSKSKRFSSTRLDQESHLPGPGSYAEAKVEHQFNRSGVTGNFIQPKRFRDQVVVPTPEQLTPGPGYYKPNEKQYGAVERLAPNKMSVFRSSSKRGYQPQTSGPAPGQYEVLHTVGNLLPAAHGGKSACLPHAAFRSNSEKVSKELFYPEKTKFGKLPGPGSYEVDESERAATRDLVAAAQPSSMFANNMQNRFGDAYVKRTMADATPGPGWYGTEAERQRGVASSSFFMSATGRSGDRGRKAPGPAFYKPDRTIKKSFLLNATRKWV